MKKYGWFIVIGLVIILGVILLFVNQKKETSTSIKIDTQSDIDDTDFSVLTSNEITLGNESIKIVNEGEYNITGELSNGMILVNSEGNIKLVLNNVTINNEKGPAIYIENAKNTYIELIGNNTLTSGSEYSDSYSKMDGTIYSSDDLIFEGDGTLNVTSNYLDAIVSKDYVKFISGTYNVTSADDGIRGKDYVYIENGVFSINSEGDGIKSSNDTDSSLGYVEIVNGTFNIDSKTDGIQAETNILIHDGEYAITTGDGSTNTSVNNSWGSWGVTNSDSAKGIKAANNLIIENGTFTLDTADDAIHCNNSIEIKDGDIIISSGDDGIHADSELIITNGNINIKKSYEGLEASNITINNGEITLISSDDGINVAGGNDQSAQGGRPGANQYNTSSNNKLIINGGTINVNASGDGLDANGSITMTGGNVYVDGPQDNGNGALDYDNTFIISGGTLIATGSSGMAQTPSTSSSQYSIMLYTSGSANSTISIKNGSEVISSVTPTKNYQTILISSPKINKGSTYDFYINNSLSNSVQVTSIVTSNGTSQSGPGGRR